MPSKPIDAALVDELEHAINFTLGVLAEQLAQKVATYDLPKALPDYAALLAPIQAPGRPVAETIAVLLSFHAMAQDHELSCVVDHSGWWNSFATEFWPSLLTSVDEIRADALAAEHEQD